MGAYGIGHGNWGMEYFLYHVGRDDNYSTARMLWYSTSRRLGCFVSDMGGKQVFMYSKKYNDTKSYDGGMMKSKMIV